MLLIDDLLLAPLRSVLWVVEKIRDAAQEEMAGEADAITEQLRQLYMMLETGRINEAEFDGQERKLLDRLDAIGERESDSEKEDEEEQEGHEVDQGGEDDEEADGEDNGGEA